MLNCWFSYIKTRPLLIEKCISRTFSAMAVASSAILSTSCESSYLMVIFNVLIEFLDPQNLYVDTKIIILARILKKILGMVMLWRPSCPPFCKHVTDTSEINFNILIQFLDLKNLGVATKIMSVTRILKKILRTLSLWRQSWTPS